MPQNYECHRRRATAISNIATALFRTSAPHCSIDSLIIARYGIDHPQVSIIVTRGAAQRKTEPPVFLGDGLRSVIGSILLNSRRLGHSEAEDRCRKTPNVTSNGHVPEKSANDILFRDSAHGCCIERLIIDSAQID